MSIGFSRERIGSAKWNLLVTSSRYRSSRPSALAALWTWRGWHNNEPNRDGRCHHIEPPLRHDCTKPQTYLAKARARRLMKLSSFV